MTLLAMQVSHFTAALTFSFFASLVFGITQRNDPRAMFRYGAYCFAVFMGGLWVGGWVMRFLHW